MSHSHDYYAVVGNPIQHSLSPRIHKVFAEQTGERVHYGRMRLPIDGFSHGVTSFFKAGGCGLNVTVPFKGEAARLADQPSDRVRRAGAANTLWFEDGRMLAENTDGIGLVRDLEHRHGIRLAGAAVLLLGAGGAARGVMQPLMDAGVNAILIANRTVERALDLRDQQTTGSARVHACSTDSLATALAEWPVEQWIVINASSAALSGSASPLTESAFSGAIVAYDMMYGRTPSAFMSQARANGCETVIDGLGMLVEQAAESFRCWRGVRPSTQAIYDVLRAEISAGA